MERMGSPGSMMTKMLIDYGLGGMVLVEFAAEVRKREGL